MENAMAERDAHATNETPVVEPVQPDPYLWEGGLGPWAKWAVGAIVVCLVVFVLWALNMPAPEPQAGNSPQAATSSPAPAPSAATGSGAK
jgi:hypothetical protein